MGLKDKYYLKDRNCFESTEYIGLNKINVTAILPIQCVTSNIIVITSYSIHYTKLYEEFVSRH